MHYLWLVSLLWAGPVDDEEGTSEPTTKEDSQSDTSSADDKKSEQGPVKPVEAVDVQTEPEVDGTKPTEIVETTVEPEIYGSRVHGIVHIEGVALVLPSYEFGGGMNSVPTLTSGFMLNVGIGFREWSGNYSDDVPMEEFMQNTDPGVEVVAGYQVAYEVGRDRLNEAYAISAGGYLGFYEPKKEDVASDFSRFFARATNGLLLGLTRRTSLDDDQVPLPEIPQQWQLNATFSQNFEYIMIYQYSCLGFGSAEKELPWRATYGLGVGAFF